MHGDYYDELETRSADEREAALMSALGQAVSHAREHSAYYRSILAQHASVSRMSREQLASLPITRKSELIALQRSSPPFGDVQTQELSQFRRIFSSPGPIFEPERLGPDPWRMARSLYAAGVRPGQLVHNTFAYHFTPAGMMAESAAHAIGCAVFPAGVGQTEQQVEAIAALRPAAYVGTPSFLKIILERAREMQCDVSSLSHALVGAEALPESLRGLIRDYGVEATQCYATADLGLIAYESRAREGLISEEQVVIEIVRPGTGEPVAAGEVGEVVVSTLDKDYPLIRFATGDLSAFLPGISPCGRTAPRIKGWMGRADQTTKVRGMFVRPSMVAEIVTRHNLSKARLVVTSHEHRDQLTFECELDTQPSADLEVAIAASVRDVTKLRAEVKAQAPGTLPNDGRVIVDERSYE